MEEPSGAEAAVQHGKHYSVERVVFNIKGNDYRLVTAISYKGQTLLIKWIGSHKE